VRLLVAVYMSAVHLVKHATTFAHYGFWLSNQHGFANLVVSR